MKFTMRTPRKFDKRKALFSVLVFLMISHAVNGEYDKSVCTMPKQAVPPPMPILSTSFSTSVEIKNLVENETIYIQEYFDSNKNMVSLTFRMVFSTVKMLLEFNHGQLLAVHGNKDTTFPKSSCEVHLFTSSIVLYNEKPWLSSVKNLLDVIAKKSPVYKGTTVKRDMPVSHWTSCLYDYTRNMTLNADIYFRKTEWIQSYSPMSTPVQVEMRSVIHNTGGSTKRFHFVADYVNFIPFPKFPSETFLTQPGVICPGRSHLSGSIHPQIPSTLSVVYEVVDTNGKQISYEKIWFDSPKNVSRIDTKDIVNDGNPISTISDFNTGIKFTIDQFQETCYSEPLEEGDRMVSLQAKKVKMVSPAQLLYLDTEIIQYVGQTVVRGVNCDIWVGIYYSIEVQRNITVQWYFTADKISDAVGTTLQQNVLFRMDKWEGESENPIIYNVLDFNPSPIDWETFDIGRCYKPQNKTHFIAQFEVILNDHSKPQISIDFWRNRMQEEIAARAKIETIRFSQTSLEYDGGVLFYFVGTLLDKLSHIGESSSVNRKEHPLTVAVSFLRGSLEGHWSIILPSLTGKLIQLQGKAFRTLKYHDQFKAKLQTTAPKLAQSTTYATPPILFPKKTTMVPPTKLIASRTSMKSTSRNHATLSSKLFITAKETDHSSKATSRSVSRSSTKCICPTNSNSKQSEKIVFKTSCPTNPSSVLHKTTLKSSNPRTTKAVFSTRRRITKLSRSSGLSHQPLQQTPAISPGEIAGVSIATFFVGLFIGCLAMIFYNNYQRKNGFKRNELIEME